MDRIISSQMQSLLGNTFRRRRVKEERVTETENYPKPFFHPYLLILGVLHEYLASTSVTTFSYPIDPNKHSLFQITHL